MTCVAYPVNMLSQFSSAPQTSFWEFMVQIVRYLKRAPDRKLLYSDCSHGRIANLLNTNWAGSPIDKRSTIGYCVFVEKKFVS